MAEVFNIFKFPAHLEFDGSPSWYERYGAAHVGDGAEGRLVSMSTFADSWSHWEVHPDGDELVLCLSGHVTLHQERDGNTGTVTLGPGEAVVNPPGTWHTADVDEPVTALFITSGRGTQVRPR